MIPFAERLSYAARTTADRRGNAKLLGLVMAHALLCQRQRQRDPRGRLVATVADYQVIYALLQPTVGREVDGLSPRAARLLKLIQEDPAAAISRREVAARVGWSYMTAARALEELEHPDSRAALLLTRRGRRVHAQCLLQLLRRSAQAAGIRKRVTPHTLRRTCATTLMKQGVSLRTIQALLGHTNLNTTALYLRLDREELRKELLLRHPRERFEV